MSEKTASTADFLVELGTEELPPTALKKLSNAFLQQVETRIKALGVGFSNAEAFATPRRLAVRLQQLSCFTPKKEQVVWGAPAKVAFDTDGNPSKAALAFAKKNGLKPEELQTENDGKADKLVCRKTVGGEAVSDHLPTIVQEALAALPIAKRMRWGASRTEFVRPAQWLVMLLDDKIIDAEVLGLTSGNQTQGHRFHCDQAITITHPKEYEQLLLEQGAVIANFDERQAKIKAQVEAEASKTGGNAVISSDLLDEVTALVEWPVALTGRFDDEFLRVPAEALIASMKEHQKYFHVVDAKGDLLPHFITVANITSKDPAQVIDGNERVIRPRLADAAFFFDTDQKTTLAARRERLKNIVFQAQLGSIFDKTERIAKLGEVIARSLDVDPTLARRAGELCKSDLVSDMVLEFDKMQGIAGSYYALNDGEDPAVAAAMTEQYQPKFAGDQLPASSLGAVIALADRLDTLVGIFGIGQPPTGSKDPFALRRASVSVLRILVEQQLDLDLGDLINHAIAQHAELPKADGLREQVLNYMIERFRASYQEAGLAAEIFMAVEAKKLSHPLDIDQRVKAVAAFDQMEASAALAAANKRVSNLLAKNDETLPELAHDKLQDAAEQALAKALADCQTAVAPLMANSNYQEALTQLAELRAPVDRFFDEVMVMCDDQATRLNRLALLTQLRGLFLQIADISLLVPAK